MERKMLEISSLMSTFTDKVVEQQKEIEQLYENAVQSKSNITQVKTKGRSVLRSLRRFAGLLTAQTCVACAPLHSTTGQRTSPKSNGTRRLIFQVSRDLHLHRFGCAIVFRLVCLTASAVSHIIGIRRCDPVRQVPFADSLI